MTMHNPPHPGTFIRDVFLAHLDISSRGVALKLGVSPSTFLRLIQGRSGVSPEMALRLSKGLGRSPESWLAMQGNFDLWNARNTIDLDNVEPIQTSG